MDAEGHLGCFQFGTTNKATINIFFLIKFLSELQIGILPLRPDSGQETYSGQSVMSISTHFLALFALPFSSMIPGWEDLDRG